MSEEAHARMRISRQGVDGLAEAAHRLFLELREAGELSTVVDLAEGVPDA